MFHPAKFLIPMASKEEMVSDLHEFRGAIISDCTI